MKNTPFHRFIALLIVLFPSASSLAQQTMTFSGGASESGFTFSNWNTNNSTIWVANLANSSTVSKASCTWNFISFDVGPEFNSNTQMRVTSDLGNSYDYNTSTDQTHTLNWVGVTTVTFTRLSGNGAATDHDNFVYTVCSCPTTPTLSLTPSVVCAGDDASISVTGGSLNDATAWYVYSGSAGGTLEGTLTSGSLSVTPSGSTTYYVRGEDGAGCVNESNAPEGTVSITPTAVDNANFNYDSSTYCSNDSDPTPTISGLSGGTFSSSPSGIIVDGSSGQIDLFNSTSGTYDITYTTNGTCPNDRTRSVSVATALTWYRDTDGDGFGSPSVFLESCSTPSGFVLNGNDCNDNSDEVGICHLWVGSVNSDWSDSDNWNESSVPQSSNDVFIPQNAFVQPTVVSDPGIPAECAKLVVETGASLTVNAGKAITVFDETVNNGTILVEADATGIGSFIDNGTITGSGSFQMEQYLTGSGGGTPDGFFYYVSSPVASATSNVYNAAGTDKLWTAAESTQSYPEVTDNNTSLNVGQGYVTRLGATGTKTFTGGAFNTGSITEGSLTRTGTTELNRGYNLIGNPYPSTVSWDDASRTNLETTVWYRTNNGSAMTFDTYNASNGMGTNNNGGGDVTGDVPPTQAVWVRVDADGNTGSVTFENADRSHGSAPSIYKVASEEGTVRLTLSDGTTSDEQIILFDPLAADGFDDYDSRKFWASGIPQLYTNINEDTLTINGMNDPLNNPTVPLGMKLPNQGNYNLDATSITLTSTPVYLEDIELNFFQNLNTNPSYSFSSANGNIGDRFILHFNNMAVGVEEKEATSHVFASNGQLNVSLLPNAQNANIEVFDMAGRSILSRPLKTSNTIVDLNAPTGIYLVRVETASGLKTHKVALQ